MSTAELVAASAPSAGLRKVGASLWEAWEVWEGHFEFSILDFGLDLSAACGGSEEPSSEYSEMSEAAVMLGGAGMDGTLPSLALRARSC